MTLCLASADANCVLTNDIDWKWLTVHWSARSCASKMHDSCVFSRFPVHWQKFSVHTVFLLCRSMLNFIFFPTGLVPFPLIA
jgi:hypothetical protein